MINTHVGFAGGTTINPDYQEVCRKSTGHAEVVRVVYDTRTLPLESLLRYFFGLHDPTDDRRGNGGQYRSAVYFTGSAKEEVALARAMIHHLRHTGKKISTEVATEISFYAASGRHQRYCDTRNIAPRPPKGIPESAWDSFKNTEFLKS